jgi:hypothetical protein
MNSDDPHTAQPTDAETEARRAASRALDPRLPWTGVDATRWELLWSLAGLSQTDAPSAADYPEPAGVQPAGELHELPDGAPHLLATVGKPGTGKDVLADYMQATYAGVARMAFSDVIVAETNAYLASEPLLAAHRIHIGNKSYAPYRQLLQLVGTIRRQEREEHWTDQLRIAVEALTATPGIRQVHLTGARVESDLVLVRSLDGLVGKVYRPGNPYTAEAAIERALDHVPDAGYNFVLMNDREGNFAHYLRQVEARFGSASGGTVLLARLLGKIGPRFTWGIERRVRLGVKQLTR